MQDALISIKPTHVNNILAGLKKVELRSRSITLPVGSRLWIYSTLPEAKIAAVARVSFLDYASPITIWKRYGKEIFITRQMFNEYTSGKTKVSAIGLEDIQVVESELSLSKLRSLDNRFAPPQFFLKLSMDKQILPALEAAKVAAL